MAGRTSRKLQLGVESSPNTPVAATIIWRGPVEGVEDLSEFTTFPEDVGYIPPTDRGRFTKLMGGVKLLETPATFEQLPLVLAAAWKAVTGVRDGVTGSGYVGTYDFDKETANTIQTFTAEAGDSADAEEVAGCFVTEFSLKGMAGEALMVEAQLNGLAPAPTTFTAALSLVPVEEILVSNGKLYIDDVTGTVGTTEISDTLLGIDLKIKTGWIPYVVANGSLSIVGARMTVPEVMLDLTFEHNADAVAEKASFRAEERRLIRLTFTGSALSVPGTEDTKSCTVDLCGFWTKFSVLDEIEGNDVVTGTFEARLNTTADLYCDFRMVTEGDIYP